MNGHDDADQLGDFSDIPDPLGESVPGPRVRLPAVLPPDAPVRPIVHRRRLAALALSVTNLGILFPSSPGYIGPFHYVCMQALLMVGVGRETALGYAIMTHLLYDIPVTVWGLAALAVYGVDMTTAARRAQRASAEAVATAASAQ